MPDTPKQIKLPRLRQELRLRKGTSTFFGAPTWLVYDPVRHRYFSITDHVHNVLKIWTTQGPEALIKWMSDGHDAAGNQMLVENVIFFLHANNLTDDPAEDDYRSYVHQLETSKESLLQQALHKYLFFRIPLFRPQKYLERTKHFVSPFFSDWFFFFLAITGVLGLYFVSRQWEQFAGTFLHFFTFEGFLIYGLSLIFVKTMHELGHAYMAVRQGARVNTMGIAFLLMLPVLYTDVSDSWRLTSRRQKVLIDGAGIMVELSIAIIATFLWVFLPDGAGKSAAFVLATTSWILSLAVNLNPFMRFDGYYLLSDIWGIANLQTRAFAFGTWRLRKILFGLDHEAPEPMPKRTENLLTAYAWGVWIYRFLLFLGIALLVYHLFFKVLGVILFATEVIWFIALPIAREVGVWWKMRHEIYPTRRSLLTTCVVGGALVLAFVPWSTSVRMPAVLAAQHEAHLHAPFAGFIKQMNVAEGQKVEKGEALFVLRSPDLDHQLAQVQRRITLLEARKARRAGDSDELQDIFVIERELEASKEEAAGLKRQMQRLIVRAPVSGIVRDVDPVVHAKRWVNPEAELALIVGDDGNEAKAVVGEDSLWRVRKGAEGTFIADDPLQPSRPVRLNEISYAGTQNLDIPYLASVYGGPVAVEEEDDNDLRPVRGSYVATFSTPVSNVKYATRGVIHVEGIAESFASAVWRQVMRVFVRETGV
ncbi:MAG: biotin/lipoyl-binding protein [Hyphomicrobiaceae bacterium]